MSKPLSSLLILLLTSSQAFAIQVNVGSFGQGSLVDWKSQQFTGNTDYKLVKNGNQRVLRAKSKQAASGLVRNIKIDLRRTPYLHWRWKIANLPANDNEKTRAGDDFPVRVYLIKSGGLAFWNTHALNYVWSSQQPVETWWPNPFTEKAIMLVVESGATEVGQWREYRRNVAEDFKHTFGEIPAAIDSVAIMTDTDNTGTTVTAWYGDLYFSDQ